MSPLTLLASIRRAGIPDDAARVLLAVASGLRRYGDIQQSTALSDWQMRRTIQQLKESGAVQLHRPAEPDSAPRPHRSTHALGPGKIAVYTLTADGIALVRAIFEDNGPAGRSSLPRGVPLTLSIKSDFFFLG